MPNCHESLSNDHGWPNFFKFFWSYSILEIDWLYNCRYLFTLKFFDVIHIPLNPFVGQICACILASIIWADRLGCGRHHVRKFSIAESNRENSFRAVVLKSEGFVTFENFEMISFV